MATRKPKKAAKKAAKAKAKAPVKKAAKPAKKMARSAVPKAAAALDWHKRLQPLHDRIVVIELKETSASPAGLILPESNEGPSRAKVVAVGTGRVNKKGKLRPLDVRVGDTVLLSSHAGTRVTVATHEAWIIREEDVLGIVS